MNNVVLGAVALVVGAGVGFVIGQGEKEIVEVEKIVEVEAAKVSTLEAVKAKGFVQCGVSQGLPGFSNSDDSGKWTGIDVDVCRAVAAAVFGAPISTVLIIFEFTRSYEAALVSIIAVTICTLISHQLYAPSFFDRDTG